MNRWKSPLLESGIKTGAGAGAGVRAWEITRKRVGVLLSWVGDPGKSFTRLSFPFGGGLRRGLWQVRGPAI